jgi:ABC-type uncharacterized transport system substrate-binding protein
MACRNVAIVLAMALLWPSLATAQHITKAAKIGWLFAGSAASMAPQRDEGVTLLRALGYIEHKNINFEYRYGDNKLDQLPALAVELVNLNVNLLVVRAPRPALAAKEATKTIPIVFYDLADPVALGLVERMARPGGNLTGLTIMTEALVGKRLELLRETIPTLSHVAVLWNPESPGNALQWQQSQLQAHVLGLQVHSMEVSSADRYDSAFNTAVKARIGAVAVTPDPLVTANFKLLTELFAKYRLPALADRVQFVESGGLMSYGADQEEQIRRAVALVDKVLKGARPADIPVEQPKKFELVINLNTARQIGLTIPPSVLARADRVIR